MLKYLVLINCVQKLCRKIESKTQVEKEGWKRVQCSMYRVQLQCTVYSKVVQLSLWREPKFSSVWRVEPFARLLLCLTPPKEVVPFVPKGGSYCLTKVINRPGVAGAVLQSPPLLIKTLTDSSFVKISLRCRHALRVENGAFSHKTN